MNRDSSIDLHTTMRKTDSWWEAAIWFRELRSALCDDWEGWDVVGRRFEREEIYVYK